jgi:hypothetical protein
VPLPPVHHPARIGEQAGLVRVQLRADEPQVLELDVRIRESRQHAFGLGHFDGKIRARPGSAEQHEIVRAFLRREIGGREQRRGHSVGTHLDEAARLPDRHDHGFFGRQRRRDPPLVLAQVRETVEVRT